MFFLQKLARLAQVKSSPLGLRERHGYAPVRRHAQCADRGESPESGSRMASHVVRESASRSLPAIDQDPQTTQRTYQARCVPPRQRQRDNRIEQPCGHARCSDESTELLDQHQGTKMLTTCVDQPSDATLWRTDLTIVGEFFFRLLISNDPNICITYPSQKMKTTWTTLSTRN